jgi:hypothetical protein
MISRSVHIAVLAALVSLFSSFASAQAASLRGSQIRAIFPGHFVVAWKGGRNFSVRARSGGQMTAVYSGASLSGRWRVNGNKLCVSVNLWIGTKKRCGTLKRRGKWYVGMFRKNGTPRLKFRPQ